MIFLICYDRRTQRLARDVEQFPDADRARARSRRLELQLELAKEEGRYEVVLLEASSFDTIMETHARYFSTTEQLIGQARVEVDKSRVALVEQSKHRVRRAT